MGKRLTAQCAVLPDYILCRAASPNSELRTETEVPRYISELRTETEVPRCISALRTPHSELRTKKSALERMVQGALIVKGKGTAAVAGYPLLTKY